MRLQIDSLVSGKAGTTARTVRGRVFRILANGSVGLIDEDGRQHLIYMPEVLDDPRPLLARTDIPARLR